MSVPSGGPRLLPLFVFVPAALGVIQFYRPPESLHARAAAIRADALPEVSPARSALGRSGEVKVHFTLPGLPLALPLDLRGDSAGVGLEWVRMTGTGDADTASGQGGKALAAGTLIAPSKPGFYRLAVVRGADRKLVSDMSVAVLVPFSQKLGSSLNGYRIGTYLAERLGLDKADEPEGFIEIGPGLLDLPLSRHLRVGDFVSRDGQSSWPRYAALDSRLLDKLELVVEEVARSRGRSADALDVDVHSGFRTPSHNRRVQRSAKDSRHQYGDAADIAVDADGDGRFTAKDSRVVAEAVENVELAYPDLAGGMGLYTKTRSPYVHIDTRGKKARWRG